MINNWYIRLKAVIALNVVLFLLSTVPVVKFGYESLLDYLEAASVYIFMLEFGLRVWVCVEKKKYKDRGPVLGTSEHFAWLVWSWRLFLGRLYFCIQLNSIIDLVSVIPFWVDFGIRMANTDNTIRGRSITQFASAIRVARVFRIFKVRVVVCSIYISHWSLVDTRPINIQRLYAS